jgi:hypothetical protein
LFLQWCSKCKMYGAICRQILKVIPQLLHTSQVAGGWITKTVGLNVLTLLYH